MNILKNIYNYRELLKTNVKKDVGGKYKKSFLGILWYFITNSGLWISFSSNFKK